MAGEPCALSAPVSVTQLEIDLIMRALGAWDCTGDEPTVRAGLAFKLGNACMDLLEKKDAADGR